ncbi:outer membrane usher protein SfmD [Salmonella enterica subsp. arizonae]|uniref:Outer membrane usher protein SfmD n=1 Tax=Salmonella enterica subsp. arizonae TaxID=59203 RepID=A0A379SHB9_SALER|nr:outer membrane usher protein SfmD [Salmonella enterica subsp. arizonae]
MSKRPASAASKSLTRPGVKTDFRGYTVVPYLSPYRENTVGLNPETLPDDADLTLTNQILTPTRGAIVRARFDTRVGKRVLMTLTRSNGKTVPFGAIVSVHGENQAQSFIVGDAGQVYLTGMPLSGSLLAKWGNAASEICKVTFQLPEEDNTIGVMQTNARCN